MHIGPKQAIYLLKNDLSQQQLIAAINRSLCHAEALSLAASVINVESLGTDIMDNYLWALSEIIQEAKYLHDNYKSCYFNEDTRAK